MPTKYITWGVAISEFDRGSLPQELLNLAAICTDHASCEVVGFLRITDSYHAIVLDVGDGSFDSANTAGIRRIERIAIGFNSIAEFPWEVRALRIDFPLTMHQNHVLPGEPRSLCLYFEPWSSVERSWTPQGFLNRIFWWLRETAEETLHRADQPLEQLFFNSKNSVVLPEDYFDRLNDPNYCLEFEVTISEEGGRRETYKAKYVEAATPRHQGLPRCIPVSVMLPPIGHGRIEEYPFTLGELIRKIRERESDILEPLRRSIASIVSEQGISLDKNSTQLILLIIGIPLQRDGAHERTDVRGFMLNEHFGRLGESISALTRIPDQLTWFVDYNPGHPNQEALEEIPISPVGIKFLPSRSEVHNYSGISHIQADVKGVIAGTGALGSAVAELWARECWGNWEYVDDDFVEPHNLVRHIAYAPDIGFPKAALVSHRTSVLFSPFPDRIAPAHVKKITDDIEWAVDLLSSKDIIIDASTTLVVPRDLSLLDIRARVASIFLTPSGMSSVLLLEDKNRNIRSLSLEAQYYRAILLSESWGRNHLQDNQAHYWVGAGCRDISVSMSNELVMLHAAVLSRQLRQSVNRDEARIAIWEYEDSTGSVSTHQIEVEKSIQLEIGEWSIIFDSFIGQTLKQLRIRNLPNETGGILIGNVDQKIKTISLVLAMNAPEDSVSSLYGFVRGTSGAIEQLEECHQRTGGIVSYVGEWHSHPDGCSVRPSTEDLRQLEFISDVMKRDGMPAVVVIVSESSLSITVDGKTNEAELDFSS